MKFARKWPSESVREAEAATQKESTTNQAKDLTSKEVSYISGQIR